MRKQITIWNITCGEVRSMVFGLLGIFNPLFIISFLPEKYKEKYICFVWDRKKDHEIRSAYFDSTEWIQLSYSEFMASPTLDRIASDCIARLRDRIWPQIEKRNMKGILS